MMERAGVRFTQRDGVTPRAGPVRVDFARLLMADTLVSHPAAVISPSLSLLGWVDDKLDWVRRILPFMPSPM